MARVFMLLIGGCLALGSCTQRAICPAFQSAYIYDRDQLRKKFSYFQEDSTPKVLTASKNKYLVAEPTPYRKKVRSLRTVPMKPVYVQVPDSLLHKDSVSLEALDRAARSVYDTTIISDRPAAQAAPTEDSVYVITVDRELRLLKYNGADSLDFDPVAGKYVPQKPEYYVKDVGLNIEQDNYMWYLRDHLVLPDVRLARLQQSGAKASETKATKKKEKKKREGGFFKNLFRKKEKPDSTAVPPPPQEEFDFIETDSVAQLRPAGQEAVAQRGFFAPAQSPQKESGARIDDADRRKRKSGNQEGRREDGF